MSDRCPNEAELAGLADVPAGDPRRAHAESCPRCRALLAEYAAFLAAVPDVPEAELADADTRLADVLAREVAAAPGKVRAPESSFGERFARWWRTPAARPALAFAAVAVVAGGVAVVATLRGPMFEAGSPAGAPVMRGAAAPAITLSAPARAADGSVRLAWSAMPEADAYDVVLYSPLLETVGLDRVTGATTLDLPSERVAALSGGDTLLVRVRALRAGARIGESGLEPLLPR